MLRCVGASVAVGFGICRSAFAEKKGDSEVRTILRNRFQTNRPAAFIFGVDPPPELQKALTAIRIYNVNTLPCADYHIGGWARLGYITQNVVLQHPYIKHTNIACVNFTTGNGNDPDTVDSWVQSALGLGPSLRCSDWVTLLPLGHNVLYVADRDATIPSHVMKKFSQICEEAKNNGIRLTIIVLEDWGGST